MRKLSLAFLFSLVLSCGVHAADVSQFSDKLDQITDKKLQTTLKNSIEAGLIETQADFDATVARAERSANSNSTIYYSAYNKAADGNSLRSKIESLVAPIKKLDKDALKVTEIEKKGSKMLFADIEGKIPASYKATVELCRKFDPRTNTPEKGNNKAINAYFESIKNDPCIKYALETTNTSIEQMKNNWFGVGAGFEHVIAGEIKGSKVSGYHWWYKYYADERDGRCQLLNQLDGLGDQAIFTGSFMYDPDGDGNQYHSCKKPKGGFTNGNSACALLAMGHIAIETARKAGSVPGAFTFNADVSGKTYTWQVYTMNGTLRSLYPMVK